MITVNDRKDVPEVHAHLHEHDDVFDVYFEGEDFVIARRLDNAKKSKSEYILNEYSLAERILAVGKDEYNDMQAASVVGVGSKGRSIAETKLAFKDAVLARQAIQDKRDTLMGQVSNSEIVEDVELINW